MLINLQLDQLFQCGDILIMSSPAKKCDLIFSLLAMNECYENNQDGDIDNLLPPIGLECRLTVYIRLSETEKIRAKLSRMKVLKSISWRLNKYSFQSIKLLINYQHLSA